MEEKILVEAEKNIKNNVNVVGYDSLDIAVFIAITIKKLGYTVLLTDCSPEKDILSVLSQDEYMPEIIRYGIEIVDESVKKEEKYDLHITYFGRNIAEAAIADKSEIQILVTDMYAEHAKAISKIPPYVIEEKKKKDKRGKETYPEDTPEDGTLIKETPSFIINNNMPNTDTQPKGTQIVVLNDLMKIKYGAKYLLSLINHKEIKKVYQLHFNTMDFETKVGIGHEHINLKALTENYKIFLNEMAALILGTTLTKKQIKSIYKK